MYNCVGILDFPSPYVGVAIAIIASYMIGNISPAILIGRIHGIDIRKEGSGNAGTTNVLRVLGKKAAITTLLIDVLKGTIAVVIFGLLFGKMTAMVSVLAVFIGHIWPAAFGFKGGKGVATAFGALLGLNPVLALVCLAVVIIMVLVSKRMSVGAITACIAFPFISYFTEPDFMYPGTIMAMIILIKHRENIRRLASGEEPKLSFKK